MLGLVLGGWGKLPSVKTRYYNPEKPGEIHIKQALGLLFNLLIFIMPSNIVEHRSLRESLEISNFDLNAVLRGAELTVVGGEQATLTRCTGNRLTKSTKLFELYRIRPFSQVSITSRLA
jgi:hypothetical protein